VPNIGQGKLEAETKPASGAQPVGHRTLVKRRTLNIGRWHIWVHTRISM